VVVDGVVVGMCVLVGVLDDMSVLSLFIACGVRMGWCV